MTTKNIEEIKSRVAERMTKAEEKVKEIVAAEKKLTERCIELGEITDTCIDSIIRIIFQINAENRLKGLSIASWWETKRSEIEERIMKNEQTAEQTTARESLIKQLGLSEEQKKILGIE